MARRKSQVLDAPAPADASQPAEAAPPAVTRTIDLAPEDYACVTWRKREALERPEPPPFDFGACRERLKGLRKDKNNWVSWRHAGIAHLMAPQEAHFWLLALTADYEKVSPKEVAERVREKDVTGKVEVEAARKKASGTKRFSPFEGVRVLCNLFDPAGVMELMQDEGVMGTHWQTATEALAARAT